MAAMGLLRFTVAAALAASAHSYSVPDTTTTETLTRFVFTCPCDSATSVSVGTVYPTSPAEISNAPGWHDWDGSVPVSSGALTLTSSSYSPTNTWPQISTSRGPWLNSTAWSESTTPASSTRSVPSSTSAPFDPTSSQAMTATSSTSGASTSIDHTTSAPYPTTTSHVSTTTASSSATTISSSTSATSAADPDHSSSTTPAHDAVPSTTTSSISSSGSRTASLSSTTSIPTLTLTSTTSSSSSTTLTADISAPTAGQPFSIQVDRPGSGKHKRDILVVGYVNGALVLVSSPADAVAFVLTSDGVLMIFGTGLVVGFGGGSGTSALVIYSSVAAMPTTIVWSVSGGALVLPGAGFCVNSNNVMSVNVGAATDSSCAPVTPVPDTDTDSYNTDVASTVTPSPQTTTSTTLGSSSATVNAVSTTASSSLFTTTTSSALPLLASTTTLVSSTSSLTTTPVYVSTSSTSSLDSTTSDTATTTTTTTTTTTIPSKTEETSGPNCSILPLDDQTAPGGTQYTQFFYSCHAAIPTYLGSTYSVATAGVGNYDTDPTAFLRQCVANAEQVGASVWTYYQSSPDFNWHCGFWTGLVAGDGIFMDDSTIFTMNAMKVIGADTGSDITTSSSSSTTSTLTTTSTILSSTTTTLTTTSSPSSSSTTSATTTTSSMTSTTSSASCVATSASVGDTVTATNGDSWVNFFASGCGLSLDWQTLNFNNLYVYQRSDYTFEEALLDCANVADTDGSPVFEFETDIRNNNRWVCWTLNDITNDPSQFQPYPGIADAYGYYLPSRMVSVTSSTSTLTTTSTSAISSTTPTLTATTSSSTSTTSSSATSTETFYVIAETGVPGRKAKRDTEYLILDPQTGLSSLSTSQTAASLFTLADDESLMVIVSGTALWVGISFGTPTQLVMETIQPSPPVTAIIDDGSILIISGVEAECIVDGGLVVSTDNSIPDGCILATLRAVDASTAVSTTTSSTSSATPFLTTSATTTTTPFTLTTPSTPTPTRICENGAVITDSNGDSWETLCQQGSYYGWTFFTSYPDVTGMSDCINKCNADENCNAVSIEYKDAPDNNMCGFIYMSIDFQPYYFFVTDTAIKISGENARSAIDVSGSSTSTSATTSVTTTTSPTSTTTTLACTPSAVGDVTALYDSTQTFRNTFTGCGESLEGGVSGGLQYLPKQFAVNWLAADNYEGYTFDSAVSRCVQFAVDNGALSVEFYVDVDQNWMCVGVTDLTLDSSSFYLDTNVVNVWGFVWENSCQNTPLSDITASDGTIFSSFFTGCSASFQGNTPGGLVNLPRVVSGNWQPPDYSGYTFDAAVQKCAESTILEGGTMFEFYVGADDDWWYCIAVNDLPVPANVQLFYPDTTVSKVWGFAITDATQACEPSQLTSTGSVQLANGTVYTEFLNTCHMSIEGDTPGGAGYMLNSVFGFQNPPYDDGSYGGWTLETLLPKCIQDSATAGATLIEFYESNDEEPTWWCWGFKDIPAQTDSFYGDANVNRLWAFKLAPYLVADA